MDKTSINDAFTALAQAAAAEDLQSDNLEDRLGENLRYLIEQFEQWIKLEVSAPRPDQDNHATCPMASKLFLNPHSVSYHFLMRPEASIEDVTELKAVLPIHPKAPFTRIVFLPLASAPSKPDLYTYVADQNANSFGQYMHVFHPEDLTAAGLDPFTDDTIIFMLHSLHYMTECAKRLSKTGYYRFHPAGAADAALRSMIYEAWCAQTRDSEAFHNQDEQAARLWVDEDKTAG